MEKMEWREWGIGAYINFFSTCKFFSLSLPDTVVPGLRFHVRVSDKESIA